MTRREMDWPTKYGMDHPTWPAPDCFLYTTAEAAQAAIDSVYGADSGHVVVVLQRVAA